MNIVFILLQETIILFKSQQANLSSSKPALYTWSMKAWLFEIHWYEILHEFTQKNWKTATMHQVRYSVSNMRLERQQSILLLRNT